MKNMKNRIKKLTGMFIVWRAGLRLAYAIRKADKAHARTGDRYYVMPDAFDRLVIMRRHGMRNLRRHGIMDRRVRMSDLLRESFYFTPDRGGQTVPQAIRAKKREMYLRYVSRKKY
jgi:hypothetical protein